MKDPKWQAIYRALRPYLRETDIIVAPGGDWPVFPCGLVCYNDLIAVGPATVFVLHKGHLPAIDKAELQRISADWQCLCCNEVFICFSRDRRRAVDARFGAGRADFAPLRRYLDARALRRRDSTIWFVHLPKAAGTSFWRSLQRNLPAQVYFTNTSSFVANPPDPGEYDLIGGHLPLSIIQDHVGPKDLVIGLMRHPTERLMSAFLHSRRPWEDGGALAGDMTVMRRSSFARFLESAAGHAEAQIQLFMLGHDCRPGGGGFRPEVAFTNACRVLADPRYCFGTCEGADEFRRRVSARLGIRLRRLGWHNRNDHARLHSHVAEFDRLRRRVDEINRVERALYEVVAGGVRPLTVNEASASPHFSNEVPR